MPIFARPAVHQTHPSLVLLAACLWLVAAVAVAPTAVVAEEPREVEVTNLPEVQKIEGEVRIENPPPPATSFWRRTGVTVVPADRSDPDHWTEVGIVEAAGYAHVVLSLRGVVQGRVPGAGVVGAVLVPEQDRVIEALHRAGVIQFPLEATATVAATAEDSPAALQFASDQPDRQPIAFPRYRVFVYNGTGRAVIADLYAYLSN